MKATGTWSTRRYFWLGMLLVVVLVGLRIAWLQTPWGASRGFAGRKTGFILLYKRYNPKWEPVYEHLDAETLKERTDAGVSPDPGSDKWPESSGRVVIHETIRSFLGREDMYYELGLAYTSYDSRRIASCRVYWYGHFSNGCGVHATRELDDQKQVVTIYVVETVHGASRKATFKFRLTDEGFVALVDGEEWAMELPH